MTQKHFPAEIIGLSIILIITILAGCGHPGIFTPKSPDGPIIRNWKRWAPDTPSSSAKAAYKSAGRYNKRGDYGTAIYYYTEALRFDQNYFAAYLSRANVYRKVGELDKAIADSSKALELYPDHPIPYYDRGDYYRRQGRWDEAAADFEKAIDIEPRIYRPYYRLGRTYYGKGDWDRSLKQYNFYASHNPNDHQLYANRAKLYEKMEQYGRAIADYEKAVSLRDDYATAHNSLAWLLSTCKDERYRDGPRAVRHAQKAVALVPESAKMAQYLKTLAAAYAESGRFEEAVDTQTLSLSMARYYRVKKLDSYEKRLKRYQKRKR